MILKVLFWLPVLLILHTYVVYPLILVIADRLIPVRSRPRDAAYLPGVSVLMSVHNEEEVISKKIEALFSSVYPSEKFEVLVGSDASDDRTDSILQDLKNRHKNLTVVLFGERKGKPSVINTLAESASGEILIITDANVIPDPMAVRTLAENFADNRVGLADSGLVNTGAGKEGISLPGKAYITLESKIKNIEGRLWGTMMGPFGGFYAIRKSSYLPNDRNILADDFRICMNVIRNGESAISDHRAVVYEDITDSLSWEFSRKVRISAGNFQNLSHFAVLLLKPFSKQGFCFISHKALRWIAPFLWFMSVFFNVLLLGTSFLYSLLFILQVIFVILPPLDLIIRKFNINLLPLRFFTHFYFMNIALLAGFVKYLQGIGSGAWTPTKRYQ